MKGFKACLAAIAVFVVFSSFGLVFALDRGVELAADPNMNTQLTASEDDLPDLEITDMRFVKQPAQGDYISWIRIKVKNQGTVEAKENTLKLSSMVANCFKPDACKPIIDLIQGNIPVPAIKSGETKTIYWSPPTPTSWIPGRYTIVAEVDTQKEIRELNEENNTMIFATSVPTLAPDQENKGPLQSQQ